MHRNEKTINSDTMLATKGLLVSTRMLHVHGRYRETDLQITVSPNKLKSIELPTVFKLRELHTTIMGREASAMVMC